MIKLNNKFITIIVNILLIIWQLPTILIGLIFWAVFRKFEIYTNEYNHITVINVDKGNLLGTACFSSGPIIFTTTGCSEVTKRHETGHSKQSLYLGPLFHIVISIPSIVRFWIKRICHKDHDWYLNGWPESSAEKFGGTKELK